MPQKHPPARTARSVDDVMEFPFQVANEGPKGTGPNVALRMRLGNALGIPVWANRDLLNVAPFAPAGGQDDPHQACSGENDLPHQSLPGYTLRAVDAVYGSSRRGAGPYPRVRHAARRHHWRL